MLQKIYFGLIAQSQAPLKSKDGWTILKTNTGINARWREHVEELLNQTITFDRDIMHCFLRYPADKSLNKLPTLDGVWEAIKAMQKSKDCGLDRISAEVYKYGGNLIQHQLYQLVWKSGQMKPFHKISKTQQWLPSIRRLICQWKWMRNLSTLNSWKNSHPYHK